MKVAICGGNQKTRADCSALMNAIARKNSIKLQLLEYETDRQLEFALTGPEEPPDIVLLDISMSNADGMATGKRLRFSGFAGIIIYLSDTSDYMLPAFDVEAFNYVLKSPEATEGGRFEKVFVRAAEKSQIQKRKYILLNGISEHRNLAIDSIFYFESLKHVITVHYSSNDSKENESFEFISTLSRVEDALSAYGFIRTHRSFLVNSAAVTNFDFKTVGLIDGAQLPVGRKRYPALRAIMRENAAVNFDTEK